MLSSLNSTTTTPLNDAIARAREAKLRTRAERIAIGVYALEHHKNFARGVIGHERTQAAESIMRVVIDALDAAQ
jgi:hypothetical protein